MIRLVESYITSTSEITSNSSSSCIVVVLVAGLAACGTSEVTRSQSRSPPSSPSPRQYSQAVLHLHQASVSADASWQWVVTSLLRAHPHSPCFTFACECSPHYGFGRERYSSGLIKEKFGIAYCVCLFLCVYYISSNIPTKSIAPHCIKCIPHYGS